MEGNLMNKRELKPGMVAIPKTLAIEIHENLVSSRKIREEYNLSGIEYTEILYKQLRKWMER